MIKSGNTLIHRLNVDEQMDRFKALLRDWQQIVSSVIVLLRLEILTR
jgi:hypothetical protein